LKAQKASFGIYLCIGYFDKDFDQGWLDLVNDVCAAITTQGWRGSSQYSWTPTPGFGIEGMHEQAQSDPLKEQPESAGR